jgi:hypothetical protein
LQGVNLGRLKRATDEHLHEASHIKGRVLRAELRWLDPQGRCVFGLLGRLGLLGKRRRVCLRLRRLGRCWGVHGRERTGLVSTDGDFAFASNSKCPECE